nr:MAG TPA: tail fiber protein [Caudoviricetes sp.]
METDHLILRETVLRTVTVPEQEANLKYLEQKAIAQAAAAGDHADAADAAKAAAVAAEAAATAAQIDAAQSKSDSAASASQAVAAKQVAESIAAQVTDLGAGVATAVSKAAESSASAAASATSAGNAATSEGNALGSKNAAAASQASAQNYAVKTDDYAGGTDNSAKAWAVGGTGSGQPAAGDSKSWATKVGAAVASGLLSAKEWAVGSFARGTSGGGSAKDWATYTAGTVDDAANSAKAWAVGGSGGGQPAGGDAKSWATAVGAAVTAGLYSAKEWATGTFTRGSAGGGSAKDWAAYIGGTVDDTNYSAKKYSLDSSASATAAAGSATASGASAAISQNAASQAASTIAPISVADYAGLRSFSGAAANVNVTGYLATLAPSGISGMFVRDDSDTTSSDNGGTVIVASNGKRWKRSFSGSLSLDWFSVDTSDETAAWNRAGAAAYAMGIRSVSVSPGQHNIGGTVVLKPGVTFQGPETNTPNAFADYAVRVVHTATTPNTDIFVTDTVAVGSMQSSGSIRNMSIAASAGNTRYGLYMRNFMGALPKNLAFGGGFTGAMIAFQGALFSKFENIRLINTTSILVPSAILALSWNGDTYSTTVTFENIYVSGVFAPSPGGVGSVFKAQPGAGTQIVFINPVFESISGKAFDIGKGNQVIVRGPYCENVPNADSATPMFEVGVTGAAAPNDAHDTITSLVIDGQGSKLMSYSQGAATLTVLINADVAQYIELRDIELQRVTKLISGTNNTQQFKYRNVKGSSVTTAQTGLTAPKIFDEGGNILTATLAQSKRVTDEATRNGLLSLYAHADPSIASDVGTEGRALWYDKVNARWVSYRVKSGQAPVNKTWIRGDVVDNAFPSIGGPAGWACTASGTAGTATWIISGQTGVAKGPTASRPTKATFQVADDASWVGAEYIDTTLAPAGKTIKWTGTQWVDMLGNVV